MLTPVLRSPDMIARSIGAAPRQRGSSEGWTFSIGSSESSGSRISWPKAQIAATSRLGRADPLQRRLLVDALGLEQLDFQLAGDLGDGRWKGLPPAASGAVGRGDDQQRPVRGVGEAAQHRRGELGGPEVDGPHASVRGSRCSPSPSSSSSTGGL